MNEMNNNTIKQIKYPSYRERYGAEAYIIYLHKVGQRQKYKIYTGIYIK